MTSSIRVVVDTNVLVSAVLLPRSMPRRAFDRILDHGSLLISIATVTELNDVLRRPRFNPYIHPDERLRFLATLVRNGELVEVTESVTDCRDPKDNKFLELALNGTASCSDLITWGRLLDYTAGSRLEFREMSVPLLLILSENMLGFIENHLSTAAAAKIP
jgi:putative PIN family toxin of toxin-antitoxin system